MHHYTYAQIKVKAHERLCNITRIHKLKQRNMGDYVKLHVDTNDSKATAYSNNMDVTENVRLYNIILRHRLK